MIIEHALLNIKHEKSQEFEAAFDEARKIIASRNGYISHELLKAKDTPDQYLLLVKWETLEDHTIGFRGSNEYQDWKVLLHHFYEPFPEIIYYEPI